MNICIDRLRLNAPGLAEEDAERLALLIANGLAAQVDSLEVPCQVERIQANVPAVNQTPAELSRLIVAEILRQLSATA